MSVEHFFENHPPTAELISGQEAAFGKGESWERLSAFLQMMGSDARSGIIATSESHGAREVAQIDREIRGKIIRECMPEIGAIYIASLVPTINEMIFDGEDTVEPFVARFNEFTKGTLLPNLRIEEKHAQKKPIDSETYAKMIKAASEDKTLTSLIVDTNLLGENLRGFLKGVQYFVPATKLVLARYHERAKILVNGAGTQKELFSSPSPEL